MMIIRALILFVTCSFGVAAESNEAEKNDLQLIMSDLMLHTKTLSESILLQDFQSIEATAYKIANHPKPSNQTLSTIKNLLLANMAEFKALDSKVHNAADSIHQSAQAKQIEPIFIQYQQMMEGCHSCHVKFRRDISTALKLKQTE